MAEDTRLSAVEYVDRFFDEIRAEVRANPEFAGRLVRALGGSVAFGEEAKGDVANPYVIAAKGDRAGFMSVFATLKPAQLKQVLKENNLATRVDMTGKTAAQLLDMMYERAAGKVRERKSSIF